MAEARQEDAWERTSWVLCKLHNCHFSNRLTPAQCNPRRTEAQTGGRSRIRITRDNLPDIGRRLIGRGKRKHPGPKAEEEG